jgi:hypothetical protein
VRRSFFRWFRGEFKFKTSHLRMGTQESFWDMVKKQNRIKCVWNTSHKARYSHYWKSMWGSKDTERRGSLKAGEDCLTRAASAS